MTDRQLLRCATDFRRGVLAGRTSHMMCFAICAPLVTLLELNGLKAKLVEGEVEHCNHFWIALEDGRVLDPTADQFNGASAITYPPVYLGPPAPIHLFGAPQ